MGPTRDTRWSPPRKCCGSGQGVPGWGGKPWQPPPHTCCARGQLLAAQGWRRGPSTSPGHCGGPSCPPPSRPSLAGVQGVGCGRPSAPTLGLPFLRPWGTPTPTPSFGTPRPPTRAGRRGGASPPRCAPATAAFVPGRPLPPPEPAARAARPRRPRRPPCPPGVEAPGRAGQLVGGGRRRARHGAGGAEGRGPRTPRSRRPPRPSAGRCPPPASRPSVRPSVRAGGRRRGSDARDAAPPAVAVMSPPPAGEGARAEPPFLLCSRGWGRGDSAAVGVPAGRGLRGFLWRPVRRVRPQRRPHPHPPAVVSAGEGLGVSLASGGFWGLRDPFFHPDGGPPAFVWLVTPPPFGDPLPLLWASPKVPRPLLQMGRGGRGVPLCPLWQGHPPIELGPVGGGAASGRV